jgi:hypothetical protein
LAGGVPGQGVVVEGVKYVPKPPEMCENGDKTSGFPAIIYLKITKNGVFYLKVLNKISSQEFFSRRHKLKNFWSLKAMLRYSCIKLQKSYTCPAAWISVNLF